MKYIKIKAISALCGLALFFGGGCTPIAKKSVEEIDFNTEISEVYNGVEKYYQVEIWSSANKEKCPSDPKDRDKDITYRYIPPFTAFDVEGGGEWLKIVNKWKKVGAYQFLSGQKTGSKCFSITYEDVPGEPQGIPLDKDLSFRIDFDKGEEFASGKIFTTEEHAAEWAKNMVKLFKNNYKN